MNKIDEQKLRVELARQNLAQWRLAGKLGLPPSTFSDYLRGARPPPKNLCQRVERALRLPAGALAFDGSADVAGRGQP